MLTDRTAHQHSINHRIEILASETCGCFYCLQTFPPSQIVEWCDEVNEVGQTALCPNCGIDSVLGSASGLPIDPKFLKAMHDVWF